MPLNTSAPRRKLVDVHGDLGVPSGNQDSPGRRLERWIVGRCVANRVAGGIALYAAQHPVTGNSSQRVRARARATPASGAPCIW